MGTDIEFIPDLIRYPQICDAQKEKNLIVFVGAGVSAIWGCKRWWDMASSLMQTCYEKEKIGYFEKETLLTKYRGESRKMLTIVKDILGKDDYLSELSNLLNPCKKSKYPDLFNNLKAFNAAYITTNIDGHLSDLFNETQVYWEPSEFRNKLKPGNIIHLHGRIEKSELVMTIDEYIDRYNLGLFRNFLEDIFTDEKKVFLFTGYGLDEMEIIDFMIQKYGGTDVSKRFRHRFFILLPFFRVESKIVDYEQKYFDKIKMTIIPYAIDTVGYEQLDVVLATWRKRFEGDLKGDTFIPSTINLIDRNL